MSSLCIPSSLFSFCVCGFISQNRIVTCLKQYHYLFSYLYSEFPIRFRGKLPQEVRSSKPDPVSREDRVLAYCVLILNEFCIEFFAFTYSCKHAALANCGFSHRWFLVFAGFNLYPLLSISVFSFIYWRFFNLFLYRNRWPPHQEIHFCWGQFACWFEKDYRSWLIFQVIRTNFV